MERFRNWKKKDTSFGPEHVTKKDNLLRSSTQYTKCRLKRLKTKHLNLMSKNHMWKIHIWKNHMWKIDHK